jgi:chromosome segregation ATPase
MADATTPRSAPEDDNPKPAIISALLVLQENIKSKECSTQLLLSNLETVRAYASNLLSGVADAKAARADAKTARADAKAAVADAKAARADANAARADANAARADAKAARADLANNLEARSADATKIAVLEERQRRATNQLKRKAAASRFRCTY